MSEDKIVQLSEIEDGGEIELGRGNVISTGDLSANPGNYPVYSSSAVGLGEFGKYGKYMFDEPLITWSVDGGGRPFLRKKHRFSVTNVCGYLRIRDHKRWDYGYLHAAILKAYEKIQFDYQAKAHPSVIRELYHLRWIPINEQRLIASILDTLDTQIEKTEALLAKLEKVKEGLLHDLLTRGIDENGQLRPIPEQAPELYKESPLGLIPREWSTPSISEICSHIVDCPHSTPLYSDSGVLVARTSHIKNGEFLHKSASRVSESEYEKRVARLKPKSGDIIFTREAPVGEAFIIPEKMRVCLGQRVMLLRPENKKNTPEYIVSHIYSGRLKEKIQSLTAGTTNPHLNVSEVGGFLIPTPSLQEQKKINTATGSLFNRISEEKKTVAKLIARKRGLMDDLLTGRVRVTPLLEQFKEATSA